MLGNLTFLVHSALARFRRTSEVHNDNLRAGQFAERAAFSVYRAMIDRS